MRRFIPTVALSLVVCALVGGEHAAQQPNQPGPKGRQVAQQKGKQDVTVLSVEDLSRDRNKYLNKTVRVRGSARMVQDVVGMHKAGQVQFDVVCLFDRTQIEGVRARFNGDASGGTERTLTIEGEVFQLRSNFPGMENAMMMRNCKLLR